MFAFAVGGDISDLEGQITFIENKLVYLRKIKEKQDEIYWAGRRKVVPSSFIPTIDLTVGNENKPTGGAGTQAEKMVQEFIAIESEYQRFIDDITGRTDKARLEQQQGWLETARLTGEITQIEFDLAMDKISKVEGEMSQFAIQAARNIENVLGDSLYNVLSGRFDDIGQAFLDMINRMMADLLSSQLSQVLFGNFGSTNKIGGILGQIGGAIAGAFSSSGGISYGAGNLQGSLAPSYGSMTYLAEGGYTGHGGKYEAAGIVHRGEYVLSADATKKVGVGFLDRLNKGYANGGYVGDAQSAMGGNVNINIKTKLEQMAIKQRLKPEGMNKASILMY